MLVGALLLAAGIASAVVVATRPSPALVPVNSVGLIDPKTNKVVGHVAVGSRPDGVAFGEGAVWVANLDDKTLSRVDPKQRTVTKPISLDATPTGLATGFGAVWVAHGLVGTVSRVAPQYNGFETIHPPFSRNAPAAEGSIAVGAGSVWVVFGDSSVSRIDPASRHVVTTLYAGNHPSAVAYGLRSVWVANTLDSSVTRINPITNGSFFGPDATVGLRPEGIAVGDGAVWVTTTGDNRVSRIEPNSSAVTSFSVGQAPVGIAFGLGSVWVANSGDGTVSRIDPTTNKVVATIRVGNSPRGIAVGAGYVWVTVQAAPRPT
jgi:YVTN family beta-propeller protein